MYEVANIESYMPLFYGLFYALLFFSVYSIVYLKQKRQATAKKRAQTE